MFLPDIIHYNLNCDSDVDMCAVYFKRHRLEILRNTYIYLQYKIENWALKLRKFTVEDFMA